MCSFIKLNSSKKDLSENVACISRVLEVKGSSEIEIVGIHRLSEVIRRLSIIVTEEDTHDTLSSRISKKLKEDFSFLHNSEVLTIVGFSRLSPEIENQFSSLMQPYINKNNEIIVAHGTIPEADEIAKKENISIDIDTDLYQFLPFEVVNDYVIKKGGKISALKIDNNYEESDDHFHNGLGIYDYEYKNYYNKSSLIITTNINCDKLNFSASNMFLNKVSKSAYTNNNPIHYIALYSGGLDITCAVQKILHNKKETFNDKSTLELVYYDWGTVAAQQEIISGKLAFSKLSEKFKNISIKHTVIKVESMFKNILSASELESTRLQDKNAKGAGNHEAEAAISYVPYRNTFLIMLAASRAENLLANENVEFIIGANLSEGMVYLDNSETWLDKINDLIKVGGQSCSGFNVVAPYINATKTEMLKDAIKLEFDLDSFSCYFPVVSKTKNNNLTVNVCVECGVCGSCILKKNALIRSKK